VGARHKRKLGLSEASAMRPILLKPENSMGAVKRAGRALRKKNLCVFSERHLQFAIQARAGGTGPAAVARGHSDRFVLQGEGAVNGEALRKYSAFLRREEFALSSDTGMELLLVGLPIFAEQEAAPMLAAE